jgi:serine/threonine protein phosphatase 1
MRIYAIGDIHGCDDLLSRLLQSVRADADEDKTAKSLVFLGDYVDRGPTSKAVIERLCSLHLPGWQVVFLRGNHDQTVLDFLDDPTVYRVWKGFGAAETLLSYGVLPPRFDAEDAFRAARDQLAAVLPPAHLEFLRALKLFHVVGDYAFVHAGLRPGIALERQSPEDLMWIRDEFLYSDRNLGKVVVHGHTPTERPVRRSNRIGVDTGGYATGCLTAVVLEGEDCRFISAKGMESHT